ncbi:hypothetical protein ACHAP8_003688 [Fusarium lateritium]
MASLATTIPEAQEMGTRRYKSSDNLKTVLKRQRLFRKSHYTMVRAARRVRQRREKAEK